MQGIKHVLCMNITLGQDNADEHKLLLPTAILLVPTSRAAWNPISAP